MATYKLKIDARNKKAKALLDYLLQIASNNDAISIELDDVESRKQANKTKKTSKKLLKAIQEVEHGKVTKITGKDSLSKALKHG